MFAAPFAANHTITEMYPRLLVTRAQTRLSIFGASQTATDGFYVRLTHPTLPAMTLNAAYYTTGGNKNNGHCAWMHIVIRVTRVCGAVTTVTVSNSGSSAWAPGLQVLVSLNIGVDVSLRSDCADVSVWSSSPRRRLAFWVHEDDCGRSSIRIWVALAANVPVSSSVSLDIFTGCPTCADSLSSAEAVFPDGFYRFVEPNFRDFIIGTVPTQFNGPFGSWTLPGGAPDQSTLAARTRFVLKPDEAVEFGFRHRPAPAALPDCPQPLFYFGAGGGQLPIHYGERDSNAFLTATCTQLCRSATCTTCSLLPNPNLSTNSSPTFLVDADRDFSGVYTLRYRVQDGTNVAGCSVSLTASASGRALYVHTNDGNAAHSAHIRWAARRRAIPNGLGLSVTTRSEVVLVETSIPAQPESAGGSSSLVQLSQNGQYYPAPPADPSMQTLQWRSPVVQSIVPNDFLSDAGVPVTIRGRGASLLHAGSGLCSQY
jgi:hypothetical protein